MQHISRVFGHRISLLSTQNKEVFYESRSRQTLVEIIHQKGNFNHLVSEHLGAQVLELPYTGESASLVILLPPFALADGLERVFAQLSVDALREALAPGSALARPLDVAIPKLSIEQSIDLKPTLTHLGFGAIFGPEAEFSDFVREDDLNKKGTKNKSGRRPITLDADIHCARVDLDKTGTEAAAATALFSFRSSRHHSLKIIHLSSSSTTEFHKALYLQVFIVHPEASQ